MKLLFCFVSPCGESQSALKDAPATAITVWILIAAAAWCRQTAGRSLKAPFLVLSSKTETRWKPENGWSGEAGRPTKPRRMPHCALAVALTVCRRRLRFWCEGGQQEVVAPPQTTQAPTQQGAICSKTTQSQTEKLGGKKTRLRSTESCQDASDAVVFTRW